VTAPPPDWSLLDDVNTVQLETRPDDPYSINIWAAGIGADVYIATGDDGTRWTEHVEANHKVRLRVGNAIFPLYAVLVHDRTERQRVSNAYVAKYGMDADDNWVMGGQIFRLDQR
jgi:hypothetical protein